jgi:hypothetical protein
MSKRNRVRAVPPMIRSMIDQSSQIINEMALLRLCNDTATKGDVDELLKVFHLLQFANDDKPDEQAKIICDLGEIALSNIIAGIKEIGAVRADDEEKKALRALLEFSVDYWNRQSGLRRDACVEAVNAWYEQLRQARQPKAYSGEYAL